MRFKIYGDYGYVTENLLEEFDDYQEALAWFNRYTRGDLGGYAIVEIAEYASDGEYLVHKAVSAEEY